MLIPKTNFRLALEKAKPATGFWLNCGLGHPAFKGNPLALLALESVPRIQGSNHYACEIPSTVIDVIKAFIYMVFDVMLKDEQIAVPTIGTRCVPGFISLQFLVEHKRPMRWLAEAPGYPGHTVVINQYGGICDRAETFGAEFIDVVEDIERKGELDKYDAIIFQAVVNPTAKRTSDSAVRRIAELASRSGKLVYFDGAYQCVASGRPVPSPLLGVNQLNSNIIWSYSTSKGDQMACLGYSLLVGDPRWVAMFTTVQSATREGGSLAGYRALDACLTNVTFLQQTSRDYDVLHELLAVALEDAGIWLPKREGSIFAYVPLPELWLKSGRNSFDYAMELARKGILTYTDLQFMGKGDCLRMNLQSSLRGAQVRQRVTETFVEVNKLCA